MVFEKTLLDGVLLCKPDVFGDARGFFCETYHAQRYMTEGGISAVFVQDNRSRSVRNVLRGIHFQLHKPQAKLLTCTHGEIYDVAVDIRRGSPNFGKWTGALLNGENNYQLFIPAGFAHGFCVLSDTAEIAYKCSEFYDHRDDRGVMWNDADIDVRWPISDPVLSAKDTKNPTLAELEASGGLPIYAV